MSERSDAKETTEADLRALLNAVWYALDDMGAAGRCVCGHTHAQLRLAYEPFRLAYHDQDGELDPEPDLTIAAAAEIVRSVEHG